MDFNKYYELKKAPDRKVLKLNINNVVHNNKFKKILDEKLFQVNNLTFNCYHFIRLFILYNYKKNKYAQINEINKDFIMSIFRTLTSKTRGPKQKNEKLVEKLNKFYNDEFKTKFSINKVNYSNISYILQESAVEMATCYKNNIMVNFYKYFNQFINQIFNKQINNKIKNITDNAQKKKIKKQYMIKLRQLKDSLMNDTIKKCPKELITTFNSLKKLVLPNLTKKNHMIQLKHYPFRYLQYMLYMNEFLEKNKLKMFQSICLRTEVKTKFVAINTVALIDLIINKDKNKYLNNVRKYANSLWSKIFDIKKYKLKNYSFDYRITTNGKTICIVFIKNDKIRLSDLKLKKRSEAKKLYKNLSFDEIQKTKNKNKDKKINKIIEQKKNIYDAIKKQGKKLKSNEFQYIENLLKDDNFTKKFKELLKQKKVVYGDPGKRDIVKFFGENGKQFKYSSKMRTRELKRNDILKLIESKKLQTKIKMNNKLISIKNAEAKLAEFNAKTLNYNSFVAYCKLKFKIRDAIIKEKNFNEYLLKQNWYSHINKIRHESNILNKIEKQYSKDSLFIIGDWNAKNKLPYISTPGIGFKRLMARKFKINIIDEFNTSKLNFKTLEESKNLKVNSIIKNKPKKISLYAVFTYKMSNRRFGCINRDLNAVYNMKSIVQNLLETKQRPKEFRRKKLSGTIVHKKNEVVNTSEQLSNLDMSSDHLGIQQIKTKNISTKKSKTIKIKICMKQKKIY